MLTPGNYVIGRDEDCHIRLNAALVSRQHAKLILNYDHSLIEDLGSSNGTSVNDRPVTETTRLWANQKIQVGTATIDLRRLKVEVSDMSLAPAQAVMKCVAAGGIPVRKNTTSAKSSRKAAWALSSMRMTPPSSAPWNSSSRVANREHSSAAKHRRRFTPRRFNRDAAHLWIPLNPRSGGWGGIRTLVDGKA